MFHQQQVLEADQLVGDIFEVEGSLDPPVSHHSLRGELDLAECARLRHVLAEAESGEADMILVDLEELQFTDVSGIRVLLEAWTQSLTNGDRIRITPGVGQVARILGQTELNQLLPIYKLSPCA